MMTGCVAVIVGCAPTGCGGSDDARVDRGTAVTEQTAPWEAEPTGTTVATTERDGAAEYFRRLPGRLERTEAGAASDLVASVPPEVGTAVEGSDGAWTLTLHRSISARALAEALGWERPLGVSGDVHQRSFSIRLYESQVASDRVATRTPTAGSWEIRALLTARPAGDLPGIHAGASPAYDLRERDAEVQRITFRPTTP